MDENIIHTINQNLLKFLWKHYNRFYNRINNLDLRYEDYTDVGSTCIEINPETLDFKENWKGQEINWKIWQKRVLWPNEHPMMIFDYDEFCEWTESEMYLWEIVDEYVNQVEDSLHVNLR